MKTFPFWKVAALVVLGGCGPAFTSTTVMMHAPAREATCSLKFVEASIMDMSPMGKYDVLGYVHLAHLKVVDPMADENKVIVRPLACAMGGQYVALPLANTTTGMMGTSNSSVAYAVLRDKGSTPAAPPQAF